MFDSSGFLKGVNLSLSWMFFKALLNFTSAAISDASPFKTCLLYCSDFKKKKIKIWVFFLQPNFLISTLWINITQPVLLKLISAVSWWAILTPCCAFCCNLISEGQISPTKQRTHTYTDIFMKHLSVKSNDRLQSGWKGSFFWPRRGRLSSGVSCLLCCEFESIRKAFSSSDLTASVLNICITSAPSPGESFLEKWSMIFGPHSEGELVFSQSLMFSLADSTPAQKHSQTLWGKETLLRNLNWIRTPVRT